MFCGAGAMFDVDLVQARAPWMPLVHSILGEDCVHLHTGCMFSLPGAFAYPPSRPPELHLLPPTLRAIPWAAIPRLAVLRLYVCRCVVVPGHPCASPELLFTSCLSCWQALRPRSCTGTSPDSPCHPSMRHVSSRAQAWYCTPGAGYTSAGARSRLNMPREGRAVWKQGPGAADGDTGQGSGDVPAVT